jgi:hypothetical protein
MVHHASLQKNKSIIKKFPAPVFPLHNASEYKSKQHAVHFKYTSNKHLPTHYTEPIFRAKKHDPL